MPGNEEPLRGTSSQRVRASITSACRGKCFALKGWHSFAFQPLLAGSDGSQMGIEKHAVVPPTQVDETATDQAVLLPQTTQRQFRVFESHHPPRHAAQSDGSLSPQRQNSAFFSFAPRCDMSNPGQDELSKGQCLEKPCSGVKGVTIRAL